MELRKYRPQDCEEMARLFYDTVHTVNAADYTEEQLDAWADGRVDLEKWNASFLEHDTLVAVEGETIVGFGDMDNTGYLDRLYVHKDYQKKGIAAAICDRLERGIRKRAAFRQETDGNARQPEGECAKLTFTTHASITARPFFEKRGYVVKKEQQVERRAGSRADCGANSGADCPGACPTILLTNFVMEREETLELIRLSGEKKAELEACGRILMESFAHAWNTKEEAALTLRETLESGILIAIRRNGMVAGFVGAHPEYPFGWELHPLAVAAGARGMGLGSLLTSRIEREAANAGALVMYLGTDDEDGATSLSEGDLFENTLEKIREIQNYSGHPYTFYQKCGYRIVGVLPDVNGPGKPDIFMAKRLSEAAQRTEEKMDGHDMIVNLKNIEYHSPEDPGLKIKRAFAGDKEIILRFVRENFSESWAGEAECAILQSPSRCFIATERGKVLGFACFDVSAKGFFGPIGVLESERGKQIGKYLLLKTLDAMRSAGYGYAIIGWVGDAEGFYRKTVHAEVIPDSSPENSVYANLVRMP